MKRIQYYLNNIVNNDKIGDIIINKKNKINMVAATDSKSKNITLNDNGMLILNCQLSQNGFGIKINKNIKFIININNDKLKLKKNQVVKKNKKSVNVNYQFFTVESSWLNFSFNDDNLLEVLDKIFKKIKLYDYLDNLIDKSYKKYKFESQENKTKADKDDLAK